MNLKQSIGPFAILGAVVVLALLLFGLYRMTMAPKNAPPPDAAAEHRDMAEFYRTQGHPNPTPPGR